MLVLFALEAVDVVICRCLDHHGDATPGYASLRPVSRLLVEKHVSHGGLYLVDVGGRDVVHHHLRILVLVGEARDADVLEPPVGYLFSHLLDPDAEKTLLVEVVVWVLSRLHRRVQELLHGCADNLIGDRVVVAAELLEGCLSVATDLAFILESFNDWGGGRGRHNFVPVLRGDGTKIAPRGDLFDQPPG